MLPLRGCMAPKAKSTKFIQKAIVRPGALTTRVGGPPSQNIAKTERIAKGGGLGAKQANFYLNVLKPAAGKRKKGK